MLDAPSLIQSIRKEFGEIPFPHHRGLRAALAMDDWITDETVLREITRTKDFIGQWWEVPVEELQRYMLGDCYLDEHGIEFYLPAFMVAVLAHPEAFDHPRKSSSWRVVYLMSPDSEDPELKDYFLSRFVRIVGGKKRACRDFLRYVSGSPFYNEEATSLASQVLAHEYWAVDS